MGSIALEVPRFVSRPSIWKAVSLAERLIAGLLLLLISPVLVTACGIIVLISRRSPFVAHQRVGYRGRLIWVLKLRTMWKGDPARQSLFVHRLSAAEAPLLPPDMKNARVTSRFAAFCRRYSLDEVPQLWHVVRGDMALVGPRPLTAWELETYYGSDAPRITALRPGISGLWQISGRSRLTYTQRRRLDLFLVRNWSAALYVRILILTLPRVLAGKNAW
ncbi:MAG: sugar transferase [Acidobacteriaceae bacterium]|nr:sugar transferase [Acidobacteriaceae bacterium]